MKLRFLLLFIILAPTIIKSQIVITTPYEFSIGASAGTTFSSVTFSPKVTQGMLNGKTFGLTGRMTMGENVGLQVELNYTQEGWKEEFVDEPEYKYERTMNYLQFPFYVHIQFGGKTVKGFINAGPQIGYLLSESTNENLNGATPNKTNEQHSMPVEKDFEWGLSGGAGIEFRSGIGYFLLEGRYYYSFGDIYGTQRKDYFSKASSQVISAKISYLIPFK